MAFITYILLAGMALGIQKRWVGSSPRVLIVHCWCVCLQWKTCVMSVSLKVQSWGAGTLCQHCSCVGHHRGLGDAVELVSAGSAQRPLNLWPHCLQWIQIRRVSVTLSSLFIVQLTWWSENPFVMCLFSRMIFTMTCGLLFGSDGYYVSLAWASCALMFFIVSVFHSNPFSVN